MEHINRAEVLGVVGNIRIYNPSGQTPFAKFSLVTKRMYYQASSGGDVVESTWHSIILNQGKACPDLAVIKTGETWRVTGRIRNNRFTGQDGQDRYTSDIVAQQAERVDDADSMRI